MIKNRTLNFRKQICFINPILKTAQGVIDYWRLDNSFFYVLSQSIAANLTSSFLGAWTGSVASTYLSATTGTPDTFLTTSTIIGGLPVIQQITASGESVLRSSLGFMTGGNACTIYWIGNVDLNRAGNLINLLPSGKSISIVSGIGVISSSISGNGGTEQIVSAITETTASIYVFSQAFQFTSTGSAMSNLMINGVAQSSSFITKANNTGSVFDVPVALSLGGTTNALDSFSDVLICNQFHAANTQQSIANLFNSKRRIY